MYEKMKKNDIYTINTITRAIACIVYINFMIFASAHNRIIIVAS
jgi:hypothetical protein